MRIASGNLEEYRLKYSPKAGVLCSLVEITSVHSLVGQITEEPSYAQYFK